jgi:hypothetical protein
MYGNIKINADAEGQSLEKESFKRTGMTVKFGGS